MTSFSEFNVKNILRANGIDDPDGKLAHALFQMLNEMWKRKAGKHLDTLD